MKKLIALLMVLLLTVALVGCEDDGNYWQSEDYYTQEQVDELIQNAIDELGEEIENDIPQQYYSKDEVDQLIQEQIDELELLIDNLEEIILENQRRLDELGEEYQVGNNMLDDFEDCVEILIYYYEYTDRLVDFQTFFETNFPALAERMKNYY